jgi:hypothetical protein
MIPTSRAEAIAQNSKIFRTGRTCVNGHIANRYTKSGSCSTCVLEATRKNRDSSDLRDRGFRNATFLVHKDDIESVREITEFMKLSRLT